MKKLYKSTILVGVSLLTIAGLAACDNKKSDSQSKEENRQNVMTMSTLSGIGMLEELNQPATYGVEDDILANIEKFSALLVTNDSTKVTTEASDKEGYQKKTVIKAHTMLDDTKELVLYYNETIKEEEYDEVEYCLDGIAIEGDVTYTLKGESEIESDEEELEFTLKSEDGSYVTIKQEKESDEQEFEYNLYQNGKRVFSQSIEYEIERGYTNIEFKEKTNSTKVKFEIRIKNDVTYVRYDQTLYTLEEVVNEDGTKKLVLKVSDKNINDIFSRFDD